MGVESIYRPIHNLPPSEKKQMTLEEARSRLATLEAEREAWILHQCSFGPEDYQYQIAGKVIHALARAEQVIDMFYRRYKITHRGVDHVCMKEWHKEDWFFVDVEDREWRVPCDSWNVESKTPLDSSV